MTDGWDKKVLRTDTDPRLLRKSTKKTRKFITECPGLLG